jgi:trehalose 6-phosphate phosphatase
MTELSHPSLTTLLERAALLYPTVIISGRAQDDALKRVRGVKINEAIGNHGLEPWQRCEQYAEQVQRWVPILQKELNSLHGVLIEEKVYSVAVHYRLAPDRQLARQTIDSAVAKLGRVRALGGKEVVNLLPLGAPHKGLALTAAMDRWRCDTAIYVGDDETDEDAFGLSRLERLFTVRVGQTDASKAMYFVPTQDDIDPLLEFLILQRPVFVARQSEATERSALRSVGGRWDFKMTEDQE